ncbi:hypothetical protein FPOA_11878 [Fusarium poae]|uniref:TBP-associated factor 6 n=1 Tax=Fusarium poae TaxID=36050 RepID=A0A1B8AII5_FUSPO|nr:hypothetical protein FPOA_11878 [Fusarium poae]
MAESRDAKADLHMQEDDAPSGSGFRISGTIVVGIDIGTSSSGIAYARFNPGDPTTPRCYIHTANIHGVSGSRVDTKILAGSYAKHFNGHFLEWFKMSLLRDADLPSDVHRSRMFTELTNPRKNMNVSAVTTTADYLRLLWSDFQESLKCSVYDFEYNIVIAVPSVWPAYAREKMLEAIHKANILSDGVHLSPRFIPDIDAASIALVSDLSKPCDDVVSNVFHDSYERFEPPILKGGGVVIVFDCGGFTVESAAHRIRSIQPLGMEQITRRECIFAGGALIDNDFMNLLKTKVEDVGRLGSVYSTSKIDLIAEHCLHEFANRHWEKDMKLNFCGDDHEWTFHIPGHFESGRVIRFSAFELALVFDPIVDKIVNLVRSQIEAATNRCGYLDGNRLHVIIAGGFGRSPYVQTRIKQTVLELVPSPTFHCPRGDQGCTAVARGAVLQGLQEFRLASPDYHRKNSPYVISRISLASYGVNTVPQSVTGIRWLVSEGQDLSTTISAMAAETPKLLWNPDNVKDVAESVGISSLNEEALKCLTQDVEYRVGQVIVEALRFMRASRRTTLTVNDISLALKALDVEPLYGYDSTRPLRYGEASLGPGQPLFYIEDEEIDFEKLINAPLPKVPRDMGFTAHWLAIEGVQPSIPQNPTTSESRSQELLPKGPGANPALSALAGNDNVSMKPSVKHIVSKELILYFDKIQAAVLDDNPDEEVVRLRQAALGSVRDDPGLHQLIPYFITFIMDRVTHHLDDTFTLRQMMELTNALIENKSLFLDPYASPLSAPALTCLMARKLGTEEGTDALKEQYDLRQLAASLVGQIARKYSASNTLLRPKLTRTCLKYFLDPTKPPAVLYGAIYGLLQAGGPEAIRVLVLRNLKTFDSGILQPLKEKAEGTMDYEMLVQGIIQAVASLADHISSDTNGINGSTSVEGEVSELKEFIGPIVGEKIASSGNRRLIRTILDARNLE